MTNGAQPMLCTRVEKASTCRKYDTNHACVSCSKLHCVGRASTHLAAADAAQAAFLDEAMVLGRIDPLDEYRELWLELGLESGLPQAIGSGPGSGL